MSLKFSALNEDQIMTPSEIADKAAEAVFQAIERDKRLIKASIKEAIEKTLLVCQQTPASTHTLTYGQLPSHGNVTISTGTCSPVWTTSSASP